MVTAIYAKCIRAKIRHQERRPCGPDPANDEMDAVTVYSNVCMDAVGIGLVLDDFKHLWPGADVLY